MGKILENKGIETTGLSASAINKLITAGKSGIVGRYLNECALSTTGNTVIISTGKMIIGGVQLEIDTPVSLNLSSVPTEDVRYQVVVELRKGEDEQWVDNIFIRTPSTLIQENFTQGGYTYQLELGRVTHTSTGQVTNAARTAEILYGGGGNGAEIEVGEVTTQMISTELPAEVNINKVLDDGKIKLNFGFLLPKPYEESVTSLVYAVNVTGNPVNIKNTNDGFVDKVKITNDTASAISSPLTGKSVNKNLLFSTNWTVGSISSSGNITKATNNITYTINLDGSILCTNNEIAVDSGIVTNTFVKCPLVGQNMVFKTGEINIFSLRIAFYEKNETFISRPITLNGNELSVVVPANAYYYKVCFDLKPEQSLTVYPQLEIGTTPTLYTAHQSETISIPLKDTSGTVLDLNPADVIEMIDGKYHLNSTELHDESQVALRSIPTKAGETNLIGDQPFTFDVTEMQMAGNKKDALLKNTNGDSVLPITTADNVLMPDGTTADDAIRDGLQELQKAIDGGILYDKVIRTQTDFETLIASPTWLDAVSVAFVGQFTLSTTDNSGIKIPATVKQIHGFNSAKITITNFKYHASTAKGGLWYATAPTTQDYSIRDLEVSCTGTTIGYGFSSCNSLSNCTGTGTGTSAYGFRYCNNLSNCTGTGTGTGTTHGYGFANCNNLSNCTGTGTGTGTTNGYGFSSCNNLSNCTGTGTGTSGYGFYSITYASNCKDGGSSTAMWDGINKNISVETCRKTLVNADNTTLNT